MDRDIVAINRNKMIAITDDGLICEVTNLFDENGDDTDNISEAVTAVVRVSDDEWFRPWSVPQGTKHPVRNQASQTRKKLLKATF